MAELEIVNANSVRNDLIVTVLTEPAHVTSYAYAAFIECKQAKLKWKVCRHSVSICTSLCEFVNCLPKALAYALKVAEHLTGEGLALTDLRNVFELGHEARLFYDRPTNYPTASTCLVREAKFVADSFVIRVPENLRHMPAISESSIDIEIDLLASLHNLDNRLGQLHALLELSCASNDNFLGFRRAAIKLLNQCEWYRLNSAAFREFLPPAFQYKKPTQELLSQRLKSTEASMQLYCRDSSDCLAATFEMYLERSLVSLQDSL